MTPEEIKNTDFETFFQAVPQMKEVHARTRSKTRIRTEEISGDSLCAGFRMAEAGSV